MEYHDGLRDERSLGQQNGPQHEPLLQEEANEKRPGAKSEPVTRSWGLQLLFRLAGCADSAEKEAHQEPQVVMFKSHRMALLLTTVHLPALVGTAILTYFVYSEFWTGANLSASSEYEKQVELGIQIAAKAFESSILASLATMIFTLVRREAVGKGLPLAAFFTAIDFKSSSFLFSEGFWKKALFLSLSVVSFFLAMIVAPAAATILQPIKDWRTVGGTATYLDMSEFDIFPRVMENASHTIDCPSAGWERLRDMAAYLPDHKLNEGGKDVGGVWRPPPDYPFDTRRSRVHLRTNLRSPFADEEGFKDDERARESLMMMPHRAVGDVLAEFVTLSRDAAGKMEKEDNKFLQGSLLKFISKGHSPSVQSRCLLSTDPEAVVFPDPRAPTRYGNLTIEHLAVNRFLQEASQSTTPELLFFNTDDANYSDTRTEPVEGIRNIVSIGTLVTVPRSGQDPAIYGCLTNARWLYSLMLYSGQERETMPEDVWPINNDWKDSKVTIDTSYANLTNPRALPGNGTVFHHLAEAAGPIEDAERRPESTACHVEAIVNGMLVNGMARTAPSARPITQLKDVGGAWWRNFFAQRTTVNPDTRYTVFNVSDVDGLARVGVVAKVEGYYYTWMDDTVRPLMFGLFVYCAVAVLFVAWSLGSGVASTSWESTPELLALAMRSEKPEDAVMYTSVLENVGALKQRYWLAADDERNLRLEAVRSKDQKRIAVEENEPYRQLSLST